MLRSDVAIRLFGCYIEMRRKASYIQQYDTLCLYSLICNLLLMEECLILVGPDKWCKNHINFLLEHNESLLLYDKFPKKTGTLNDKGNKMIQKGDFYTFIYVSKGWGGDGKIEYVAYTPPMNERSSRYIIGHNMFFLDQELIDEYKKITETMENDPINRLRMPVKPPGILPTWDYYDFSGSRRATVIQNVKEHMQDHRPRPYNIAIKINNIIKIECKLLDEFKLFGGGPITDGHLKNSFIIAHQK